MCSEPGEPQNRLVRSAADVVLARFRVEAGRTCIATSFIGGAVYPDLGMWVNEMLGGIPPGKRVVFSPCVPAFVISDEIGGYTCLTFQHHGDCSRCGTVWTRQSRKKIEKMAKHGSLIITCTRVMSPAKGRGGETYYPMLGIVAKGF